MTFIAAHATMDDMFKSICEHIQLKATVYSKSDTYVKLVGDASPPHSH